MSSSLLSFLSAFAFALLSYSSEAAISFPIAKVSNISQQIYTTVLQVGTPPQNISVLIDTGSSDFFLLGTDHAVSPNFNPNKSSSFRSAPGLGEFTGQYGSGAANGTYFHDTVSFSGLQVTNVTAALVNPRDAIGIPFPALMGLAYDELEDMATDAELAYIMNHNGEVPPSVPTYPNFVSQMKIQGIIKKKAYSLWLDDQRKGTGELLFGAIDKAKFVEPLVYTPIVRDEVSTLYDYLKVAWTSIEFHGVGGIKNQDLTMPQVLDDVSATLDSGTTNTQIPLQIADRIGHAVGAVAYNITDEANTTLGAFYFLPCNSNKSVLESSLTFGFGGSDGPKINVRINDIILNNRVTPAEALRQGYPAFNGSMTCALGLQGVVSYTRAYGYIFGDTFLRSAYVVYDLEDKRIGLAQSRHEVNTTDFEEIQ